LIAVSLGTFVSTIAGSIANIALPTISRAFGVTAAESVWIVNGTQLAMTASILFFAALGDARGAKRLYLTGTAVFTAASIGCMLAPSFGVLVAARVLQGFGASAQTVMTNSITRALYPPHMLGRSVAITAMFVAFATAAGPTVGGLVLSFASWRWIFALMVPLALATFGLALRSFPDVPGSGARVDGCSGLLAAIGLGALIFAVDGVARGYGVARSLGIGAAGVAATVAFVVRQTRIPEPLLALELFRVPIFNVSIVASMSTYVAQGIAYVSLPFFFQTVLGRSPVAAGALLSAWPITALAVASQMGHLSDRYSASRLCTLGIVVMGVSLAGFALLPAAPATWAIVLCAAIGGAGFGTFNTPNNRAIIASARREQTGRAAGVMSAARLTGQTSGAALVAIVFALAGGAQPGRGAIERALLVGCGFILVAATLSAVRWSAGRAEPALAG
jgi:DHA2 family multidrug resistance protein-like MFS transporter